ncbi:MAG: Uma2 family endonuclease [Armatimonadetes bacterium]|nr:Uma2 family endonuclease [Armatimonadota bacterium]
MASPTDSRGYVLAKVAMWLEVGVKVVWAAWPDERRVTVFRSESDITLLDEGDTLTCEELLPGFALAVGEVFA